MLDECGMPGRPLSSVPPCSSHPPRLPSPATPLLHLFNSVKLRWQKRIVAFEICDEDETRTEEWSI
jgi:hypothetical protein